MRALIQRVHQASVKVQGKARVSIGRGMLILLGISKEDTPEGGRYLAQRCASIRMFGDEEGKMNLSVGEIGGSALVVSQFTLYADTRKGNRPSFSEAASSEMARELYEEFVRQMRETMGEQHVLTGYFGEMMDVELVNDGPVTFLVESKPA